MSSNKIIKTPTADNTPVYAYFDSIGKVWTIGWGNTYYANGNAVKQNDKITKSEADTLIVKIVNEKEQAIRSSVPYQTLTDNQYAALISIAYNAGQGNFRASKIPKAITSGQSNKQVASVIQDSIVTSRGVFVPSLKSRRIDESKLYDGSYNVLYSYYLRNENTVKSTALVGVVLLAAAYYIYKKNNK